MVNGKWYSATTAALFFGSGYMSMKNGTGSKKLGSSQAASDSPLTSVGQLSEDILWFAEFREYIMAVEIIKLSLLSYKHVIECLAVEIL